MLSWNTYHLRYMPYFWNVEIFCVFMRRLFFRERKWTGLCACKSYSCTQLKSFNFGSCESDKLHVRIVYLVSQNMILQLRRTNIDPIQLVKQISTDCISNRPSLLFIQTILVRLGAPSCIFQYLY